WLKNTSALFSYVYNLIFKCHIACPELDSGESRST
ncbi:MAG: hypothetical protein ACI8YP_003246, partial [Algoriphagus sp.]